MPRKPVRQMCRDGKFPKIWLANCLEPDCAVICLELHESKRRARLQLPKVAIPTSSERSQLRLDPSRDFSECSKLRERTFAVLGGASPRDSHFLLNREVVLYIREASFF